MMEKEAVQYLMEQGIQPEDRLINFDDDTRWLVINNEGEAREILPEVFLANPLEINTLSGFVNYVKANLERIDKKMIVHVRDESSVYLKGLLEVNGSREILAIAHAIVPEFPFSSFIDSEEFVISFQSKFVQNDHRDLLLKIVGNAAEENVKKTSDDGISQSVEIRQGVVKSEVLVPNPVTLAPYRTFLEVQQPESQFVFRMKEGPRGAIFEADGGAWRNQAIENIREYLEKELNIEIESGRITLIA